jgi:hypothetical protein
MDADKAVQRLNRLLANWSNDFKLGPLGKTYKAVDKHTIEFSSILRMRCAPVASHAA